MDPADEQLKESVLEKLRAIELISDHESLRQINGKLLILITNSNNVLIKRYKI
jgi:hypothetical protein